ncbi:MULTISPECIES: amino acid deaminase/aldolase [Bacillus cereus group]|uniref:Amino acid aldolase n=1 Tax=Bacillus cereus TaxID=1396 RepID=A0A2B8SVZ1_BACCE|nr:amino acid deaminase/aldolase [Bacillus cereus]PDY77323.1 amino acid aldolase [Bacillus cereus]PFA16955.1 amino acid aldolase [Bacillus cereus]PFM40150.1 amino acid aldolase [Bacillus cereus]PGL57322.1 amino acid aldolase [Bacillus cereus]PGQ08606.1 amino acid aldolase [Bacillus cereus]
MDRGIFKEVPLPCAFLDEVALERNIQSIIELSGDKKIRIASKSLRSVPIMKKILAENDRFQGIMCFSPREALFLIEEGFNDLLLGYPAYDERALYEISLLTKQGIIITCMVDCEEHIVYLEKIAVESSGCFRVCLDIDMSSRIFQFHFGVRRSPVKDVQSALKIVEKVKASPYLILDGVMGYEAQIAGVGDDMPKQRLQNKLISYLKKKSVLEINERRGNIVKEIQNLGIELRFVNGGGTGSIKTTEQDHSVTEITVGSAFYSPKLFDYYKEVKFQPAVGFAVPIVRKPAPHIYTCLGGGYIASGAVGKEKEPEVWKPHGAKLLALEGAGEVQTPVYYNGEEQLYIGDTILFRHSKAGELCERFPVLYRIKQGEIVGEYSTYRGDSQCFL